MSFYAKPKNKKCFVSYFHGRDQNGLVLKKNKK